MSLRPFCICMFCVKCEVYFRKKSCLEAPTAHQREAQRQTQTSRCNSTRRLGVLFAIYSHWYTRISVFAYRGEEGIVGKNRRVLRLPAPTFAVLERGTANNSRSSNTGAGNCGEARWERGASKDNANSASATARGNREGIITSVGGVVIELHVVCLFSRPEQHGSAAYPALDATLWPCHGDPRLVTGQSRALFFHPAGPTSAFLYIWKYR